MRYKVIYIGKDKFQIHISVDLIKKAFESEANYKCLLHLISNIYESREYRKGVTLLS